MTMSGRNTWYGTTLATLTIALVVLVCALPSSADDHKPLTPLTLQLKWTHQFQFAGYYAAKELGYYKEAGIEIHFKERHRGIDVVTEVLDGRADFGVGNSQLLLNYFNEDPIVALGAVFQHAPNIILSRAESNLTNPRRLKGRRIMILGTSAADLWAMLSSQGVMREDMKLQQLSWSTDELIHGETDAMSAYITDQPYDLKNAGIPVSIMRPITYGIDFYGDTLFTTSQLAKKDPELVERFMWASFRGWVYAMAHTEEIIHVIRLKYKTRKTLGQLRYEADAMHELILPRLVEVGAMSRTRWEQIANTYRSLGMISSKKSLDDFIYIPKDQRRLESIAKWAPLISGVAALVIALALLLLYFNRRLQLGIERRTMELDRNRKSLRQVVDLVPNMIYAKNREGRFLLVNRSMAESLGKSVDDLTGAFHIGVHPDREQAVKMNGDDLEVLDTGFPKVTMEEPYLHTDGSTHWLQTTRLPYTPADTDEPAVLTLSVDITNRRIAEARLKESEERFRAMFNQTYQFSGILNLSGDLIQINETALMAFRQTEDQVVDRPFRNAPWWAQDKATQEWLIWAVNKASTGDTVRKDVINTLPNGTVINVDFTLKPARNEEHKIVFLIAEGRDITKLKESEDELRQLNEELEKRVAERTRNLEIAKADLEESFEKLRKTQEELVLSEKLAALGGLVAGVAHEINTPLGVGVTASSFLGDKIKELGHKFETNELKKSDLEKFIETGMESSASILTNLGRAAELIRSFKQVAADQSSEIPRVFNLKSYVDEVLLSLRPKYKRTEHVIENHCPDIELYSYPGAFMQIITNLLVNALHHAFPEGQAGHIELAGETKDDTLLFTFSDDGSGVPEEHMDKLFEPFYTTKRGQGGTGLGLHIVFNTVTRTLGGTIRVHSSPEEGTRFTITMPIKRENDQ